jgi:hypothetical protein
VTHFADVYRVATAIGNDNQDNEADQLKAEIARLRQVITDAYVAIERQGADDARRILYEEIRPKKERGGA